MTHPKFEIPKDPHGKARYESALRHAEAAKKLVNPAKRSMLYLKK